MIIKVRRLLLLCLYLMASAWASNSVAKDVYQEPDEFIHQAFAGQAPAPKVLWLTGDIKAGVKSILGHPYSKLRIRYWLKGQRSAWILEEIGKDKPITTGYVVNAGKLEKTKVLIYRESRGWEVKHDFFTKQFLHASLQENSDRLNTQIDGISGATLSVRAVTKLARIALFLHQHLFTAYE